VAQAVDGNMTAQVQKLKEDADDVGDRIKKGYLPCRLVWQTLRTMVWPSISYPLSSTTITEEESYEITKSLYFQILPSGGANQNFPTRYRHAPYAFFGLSIPRAIDTEFLGQIKSMLTHGAILTHTGRFLNISLEQAQLEVGIGTPILEADYEQYGFLLTFCWIKVLWKRLWEYDIVLHQPEAEKVLPKLQREGDFFIMERIVTISRFHGGSNDTNEPMPTSLPCFDHSQCTLRRWHQGYSRSKVDPMTESPTEFVGLAQ
jgi:hypothetical protein